MIARTIFQIFILILMTIKATNEIRRKQKMKNLNLTTAETNLDLSDSENIEI